jgi:hypothetical protein
MKPSIRNMGILINGVQAGRIERRRAANDAPDLVTFAQQKLGKVGAILASDSSDQSLF